MGLSQASSAVQVLVIICEEPQIVSMESVNVITESVLQLEIAVAKPVLVGSGLSSQLIVISSGQVITCPPVVFSITLAMAVQVVVRPVSLVTSNSTFVSPTSAIVNDTVVPRGAPAKVLYPPQASVTLSRKSSALTVAF